MPRIKVLPHAEICPQGVEFEAESGISVCENLLNQDIELEHACELSCACLKLVGLTARHVTRRQTSGHKITLQSFASPRPLVCPQVSNDAS